MSVEAIGSSWRGMPPSGRPISESPAHRVFVKVVEGRRLASFENLTGSLIQFRFPQGIVVVGPHSKSPLFDVNPEEIQKVEDVLAYIQGTFDPPRLLRQNIDFSMCLSLALEKNHQGQIELNIVSSKSIKPSQLSVEAKYFNAEAIQIKYKDGRKELLSSPLKAEEIEEISITLSNGKERTLVLVNTSRS